jgi:adenine phosphoribosyltransferase
MNIEQIKSLIKDVPDFPKKGVVFKDINPLLAHPQGFRTAIEKMANIYEHSEIDIVVGIEARGFIFSAGIANILSAGFVSIRKPGKLPLVTQSVTYKLEYGNDTLEIQDEAISKGQRVLIVDDVLATGGTMGAAIDLVRICEADIIGVSCFIELEFLKGRKKFDSKIETSSIIKY